MRCFNELYSWARDTVMWHWSADALFGQLSIDRNTDVQYPGNDSLKWSKYSPQATNNYNHNILAHKLIMTERRVALSISVYSWLPITRISRQLEPKSKVGKNRLLASLVKHWILNFPLTCCEHIVYYWRLMLFATKSNVKQRYFSKQWNECSILAMFTLRFDL